MKIVFKKSSNISGIVLRAYRKWRNIHSRKSTKSRRKQWQPSHLSCDLLPSLPQLHVVETPLCLIFSWMVWTKRWQLLLPKTPYLVLQFHPSRGKPPVFLIPLALCCKSSILDRCSWNHWSFISPTQPLVIEQRLYTRLGKPQILEPSLPLPELTRRANIPYWEEQAEKTRDYHSPLLASAYTAGVSSWEKQAALSAPSSCAVVQRFSSERKASCNDKELHASACKVSLYLKQNVEIPCLRVLSKIMKILVENSWEGTVSSMPLVSTSKIPEQPDVLTERTKEKTTKKSPLGIIVNLRGQEGCANVLNCTHSEAIGAGCEPGLKAFPSHTKIHQQWAEVSLAERT